jgi:hypothetical protein
MTAVAPTVITDAAPQPGLIAEATVRPETRPDPEMC